MFGSCLVRKIFCILFFGWRLSGADPGGFRQEGGGGGGGRQLKLPAHRFKPVCCLSSWHQLLRDRGCAPSYGSAPGVRLENFANYLLYSHALTLVILLPALGASHSVLMQMSPDSECINSVFRFWSKSGQEYRSFHWMMVLSRCLRCGRYNDKRSRVCEFFLLVYCMHIDV